MSDPVRHRLRLWLRSERAFGLAAVAVPTTFPDGLSDEVSDEALGVNERDAPRERSTESPRVVPARESVAPAPPAARSVADLFGAEEPSGPAAATGAIEGPAHAPEEKRRVLAAMDVDEVRGCVKCRLCQTRKKTVFGEGDADARIVFVGEGPGGTEDATGRPFVGRAGELLDKMIGGMGLRREQVFICNVVKCRAFLPGPPPKDRAPAPDEVAACTPYLERQLMTIRPAVIVTLGLPASRYVLQSTESMGRLRGRWHDWRGIRVMPTYHPAYVLRNYTEQTRAAVWSDLKQVMAEVGLPAKPRGGGE